MQFDINTNILVKGRGIPFHTTQQTNKHYEQYNHIN